MSLLCIPHCSKKEKADSFLSLGERYRKTAIKSAHLLTPLNDVNPGEQALH